MAVVATNHATNPRMRQTSGEVVVATNYFPNPTMEHDTLPLAAAAGHDLEFDTSRSREGTRSLRIDRRDGESGGDPSAVATIPLTPNTDYTFGMWYYLGTGAVGAASLRVGGDVVLAGNTDGNVKGEWAWINHHFTTNDVATNVVFYVYSPTGQASSVWIDGAVITEGHSPFEGEDFSGDSEPDGTFTYRWTGVSGASTSERVGQNIPELPKVIGGALVKTTEGALLYGSGNTAQCYVSIPGATQFGIDIKNPTTEQIEVNWYIFGRPGLVTDPEKRAWIEPGQTIRVTVDEGEADVAVVRRLDGGGSGISIVGPMFIIDRLMLNGPEPYFDGDTRDDRDSDIWINTSESNRRYYWDSTIKDWAPADEAR